MAKKNPFDMQDAVLAATADVQRLVMETLQEMGEAEMLKKVRQMWMTMPPEMKEKFKDDRPEEYARLVRSFDD